MSKICKNCGHNKGNHKFYKIHNDPDNVYYCCYHKKENGEICECLDFTAEDKK